MRAGSTGADGAELHRARDEDRDQSYFLFATTADQLDFLRFPLGDLTKAETRALADEFDLPVAAKPDSQDICFVPEGRYAGVVERLRPGAAEPGEIRHVDGRLLGRHEGVIHFTIGQRRGIGIAGAEPLYVVKLDAARRQVRGRAARRRSACAGASLARDQLAGGRWPARRWRRCRRSSCARRARRAGPHLCRWQRCALPSRSSAWRRARLASSIAATG